MSGDVHVRFCERLGGKFPGATRLSIYVRTRRSGERVMASVTKFLVSLQDQLRRLQCVT